MTSNQVVQPVTGKVPTYEFEMEMALPADTMWDAAKNVYKFISQIAPQFISSVEENVEGKLESGKPGITRTMKYGPIAPEGAFLKERIVNIDEKARILETEELEGGHLAQGFTKFSQSATVNPISGANSKSIVKMVIEYEVDQTKLKEADVAGHLEKTKEMVTALTRITEEHLQKSGASISA